MTKKKHDFSGYATRVNVKCSDGRTILKDAFKECDGTTVPLVWKHMHEEPTNVLGHALLENREDGVYAYGVFNDTENGKNAKLLVEHGDIKALSIYANRLVEKSKIVAHGVIREVSLVLAGANPGAFIDNVVLSHEDGSFSELEEDVIISSGDALALEHEEEVKSTTETVVEENKPTTEKVVEEVEHADNSEKTVKDVFDTLSEEQKTAVYAIMAEALNGTSGEEESVSQSEEEGDKVMKHNVFEKGSKEEETTAQQHVLTHDDFEKIMSDGKKVNSFREAFLAHVQTYGIENIEYLFPDARNVSGTPVFIKRQTGWVAGVLAAVYHTPFSRIKTIFADITAETARALGYTKGALKKEEVISLLQRVTTPQTVYKKQKLDRDDVVDITDFDVVVWMRGEMRMMLDEELARALLVGDGRDALDADKIKAANIRPIWTDDDLYAHHVQIAADAETDDIIDEIARARAQYRGSGDPVLYTTSTVVSNMLLLKDTTGRRIYQTQGELEAALRVAKIVEVPVMENLTRDVAAPVPATLSLVGILVNLTDYSIGADKGGAVNSFEDFDIDYNQQKYLIETRCSGALTLPKSAIVFEQVVDRPQ